MYLCICVYTHTYTYKRICVYTCTYAHAYACVSACVRARVRARVCACATQTHVSRLQPDVFGAACAAAKEHGCVPYCARKGCAVHSKRELGRRRLILAQRLHRASTLHLSFADPACPMV